MAAPNPIPVTLDPTSKAYRNADAAADAVSKDFPKQKDNEQAAIIFQGPDGLYRHSTVAPQHDHDNFSLVTRIPEGHHLAAIVHSHPGSDAYGQVFSTNDLAVADRLKVPSFIRFSNEQIRKYVPGKTSTGKTTFSGSKFGVKTATGDPLEPEPVEQSNAGNTATPGTDSVPTAPSAPVGLLSQATAAQPAS
jgi:hypothetical protein